MIDPLKQGIADIQDNIIKEFLCHARCICEVPLEQQELTYWDRDKVDAILETIFQIQYLNWKCVNFDYDFWN